MKKIKREYQELLVPVYQNWEVWGQSFLDSKESFGWRKTYSGGVFNFKDKEIKKIFLDLTKSTCSFCESSIICDVILGENTLTYEHFRPKSKYKIMAYQWENLFPCCKYCNETKGDSFCEYLLKPDLSDFDPDSHFEVNIRGEFIPKDNAAKVTIKMYGINRPELNRSRRQEVINSQSETKTDAVLDSQFSFCKNYFRLKSNPSKQLTEIILQDND